MPGGIPERDAFDRVDAVRFDLVPREQILEIGRAARLEKHAKL